MKTVSVVVPVYDNAESLPILFAELQQVEAGFKARGCALELIFVDDGSSDDSLAQLRVIQRQRPQTRVVKLARNFGAVAATQAGLKQVTGDSFTWIAADLQDPPALVIALTDRWLSGATFVIALRESRADPLLTRLFAALFHRLIRLLVGSDYPPGGFDVALIDAALLPALRDRATSNLALRAWRLGSPTAAVSYTRRERQHGRSRWTLKKKLRYGFESLVEYSRLPIRITATEAVIETVD